MYGAELIETYFSIHPDKKFNEEFRKYGRFFCGCRNSIYKYERIDNDTIKIYFEYKFGYTNVPIVKNGIDVGVMTLNKPHSISFKKGTFICKGVNQIKEKEPNKAWRSKDVRIRKSFLTKKLTLKIINDKLHLKIKCSEILPDSYFGEFTKLYNVPPINSDSLTRN